MVIIDVALLFLLCAYIFFFFFFNDTATTEIYTLSLHDALPISSLGRAACTGERQSRPRPGRSGPAEESREVPWLECSHMRSEEHTSELQSQSNLVCRLLLEKKNKLTDMKDIRDLDIISHDDNVI